MHKSESSNPTIEISSGTLSPFSAIAFIAPNAILSLAAMPDVICVGEESGICMEMKTNYPGIQIYTANYLENVSGKNGNIYMPREAVCFEPQFYPDSINKKNFVSPICHAEENFSKEVTYKFLIK